MFENCVHDQCKKKTFKNPKWPFKIASRKQTKVLYFFENEIFSICTRLMTYFFGSTESRYNYVKQGKLHSHHWQVEQGFSSFFDKFFGIIREVGTGEAPRHVPHLILGPDVLKKFEFMHGFSKFPLKNFWCLT